MQQPFNNTLNFSVKGNGTYSNSTFVKNSENGWNLSFYSDSISQGTHEASFKISNINASDKSGLVIGIVKNDKFSETSLSNAKSNCIALNAKGYQ